LNLIELNPSTWQNSSKDIHSKEFLHCGWGVYGANDLCMFVSLQ